LTLPLVSVITATPSSRRSRVSGCSLISAVSRTSTERRTSPLQFRTRGADGTGVTTRLIQLRQHSGVASPFLFLVIAIALLAMS
jgi:hypothetical protein